MAIESFRYHGTLHSKLPCFSFLDGPLQPSYGYGDDPHGFGALVWSQHRPAFAQVGMSEAKEAAVVAIDDRCYDVCQSTISHVFLRILVSEDIVKRKHFGRGHAHFPLFQRRHSAHRGVIERELSSFSIHLEDLVAQNVPIRRT